jgi:hypothetical protein
LEPHPEEPDPLLAFSAEQQEREPVEHAKTVQVSEGPAVTELRDRLDRTDRQVERALIDITTVKTDLATLVSAVEEIRRRQSRPHEMPAPVITTRARKTAGTRAVAAVVMLIGIGIAVWGLSAAMTYEAPQLPRLESRPSQITELPPIVEAQPPNLEVTTWNPDVPTAAPRRAATAPSSRVVDYFGTLTIDAEPAGEVFVNRQRVGRTPMRLEDLRAGSHLIWIEREGYRRWTRVVAVAADRISRVSASLDPLSR